MTTPSPAIAVRLFRLEEYGLEAPCRKACPVHTGAGEYVREIADGRFWEGYMRASAPNPLASVCARICAAPCEDLCRRRHVDAPVTIRALKKFVCRLHENTEEAATPPKSSSPLGRHRKKVAVIGGGPAGIACSHVLADLGYHVTIFELSERLGGALWKYIPAYRLPRSVLDRELESLTAKNVEVRLEEGLSATMTLDRLSGQGFQAFFLACGADRGLDLAIEGREARGVYKAIDYLININRGIHVELGQRVVVLGGGTMAVDAANLRMLPAFEDDMGFAASDPGLSGIDAARSAMRHGAGSVVITSLEKFADMPAVQTEKGRDEIREAHNEGIRLCDGFGPKKILVEDGRVVGVELLAVEHLYDAQGRFAPVFTPDSEIRLAADSVILAIGRAPNFSFLQPWDGVELGPEGRIKVDAQTLQSSAMDVFGGGDCAFAPGIIVEAVDHGKRAAAAIHRFLQSSEIQETLRVSVRQLDPVCLKSRGRFDAVPRRMPALKPLGERGFTDEVEGNYDEAMAREQAGRCLDCLVQTVYDADLCVLCGACLAICPTRCLRCVDIDQLTADSPETLAFLQSHSGGDMTAMIKDDDLCLRCGLCAAVCPSGAMTMERLLTSLETP